MSEQPPAVPEPAPPPAVPRPPVPVATKQPGGFGRGFGMGLGIAVGVSVLAVVLTLISTIGFVISMAALSSGLDTSTAATPRDTVWGEDDAAHTIVAVPVKGAILGESAGDPSGGLFGGTYGYDIAAEIDELDKDDADALILELDTPGGTIYGSRAIFDAVERYQERTDNPAIAYVRGMSASGGMYAMVGADEIIVDHGTMVGSIGVIYGPIVHYDDVRGTTGTLLSEGVDTEGGITQEYYTGGKGKDFGNPFREATPEERANAQTWVDAEYETFVNHVATSRQIAPERVRDEFGAFIFGADQAVANGLADSTMGQEEAYRHVAGLAEVDPDDTRVVTAAPAGFLSTFLGARSGTDGEGAAELARRETATSPLCAGGPRVMAFHGDLSAYCG